MPTDRDLGIDRGITRRDFLSGAAMAITPRALARDKVTFAQDEPGYYPPGLTGLRGSHEGAFEAAHALRDGASPVASKAHNTGEKYDLIVVGGGISGLAAAHFYRAAAGPAARILILENHDDFGGHAKRNEFRVGGKLLVTYGGTLSIESPFAYSTEARRLLEQLDLDPVRLTTQATGARHGLAGLQTGFFFDRETFGEDRLVSPAPRNDPTSWGAFLPRTPLSQGVQRDILRVETEAVDYLPELSSEQKKDRLARVSYRDFLLQIAHVDAGVVPFYQTRTHDLYGVGIDAVNALDCWGLGFPGFQGMRLEPGVTPRMGFTARGEATPQAPYRYHFPDGNASIARALVRSLAPGAAPGHGVDDLIMAKFNYGALDRPGSPVRIRLGSTAVHVAHHGKPASAKEVDVVYVREGQPWRVRGRKVVLACWNMMIPYLCPGLPRAQQEALKYGVKVPLVYTAVALHNAQAFQQLGIHSVHSPGMYHLDCRLDEPVAIGGYAGAPQTPEDPVIVRMKRTPCKPGLPERDQHRLGRAEILSTSFWTFERNIREQLLRVLEGGGFDPARDIQAITVNRWPHGYAYEYNSLFDPEWPAGERPCEIARRRFGRIAIANSDAAAAAYTDQAIDQAWRAVQELLHA